MKTSDQGKRQIRGHTLPPLENNSRNKNNEVRSSLFFIHLWCFYFCYLNCWMHSAFLIQKSCLFVCLYIIKQKQVMAQYWTNWDGEGTAEGRVSSIHRQTERKKGRAGNRNTKQNLKDFAAELRDWFNTHTHAECKHVKYKLRCGFYCTFMWRSDKWICNNFDNGLKGFVTIEC